MKLDTKQVKALDKKNQSNLKRVKSGNSIDYIQAASVVLIGSGHDAVITKEVNKKSLATKGKIKVGRELLGKGNVEITGCRDRREMEDTIARISKKKVVFK